MTKTSAVTRRAGPTLHVSFSGGEAQGYAHVGTLQAIERLGLRIVEVSGWVRPRDSRPRLGL